ncbi:hypothetical protein [Nocardia pseudobrasiliensis]|nr:hypothetical protein [Nocardia pseudobrasiliensis]
MNNPSAIPERAQHITTMVRQAMDEIRPRLVEAALGYAGEV